MKKGFLVFALLLGLFWLMVLEAKPSEDYWTYYVHSRNTDEVTERYFFEYLDSYYPIHLKNSDEVIVVDETELEFYFKVTSDMDCLFVDGEKIEKIKKIQLSKENISEYFLVKYSDIAESENGRVTYIQVNDEESIRHDYYFVFTTQEYIQTVSDSSEIKQKILSDDTIEVTVIDPIKIYK